MLLMMLDTVSYTHLDVYKRQAAIEWDGNDDYGSPVGKGTYIYKVLVKSENQEKCKGTASSVEKLVILK